MPSRGDVVWDDEKIALLKKLHTEQGLSASLCAEGLMDVFHVRVSRNAVIGKLHRLNLRDSTRTGAKVFKKNSRNSKSRPTAIKEVRNRGPAMRASPAIAPPSYNDATEMLPWSEARPLQLEELGEFTCRWPLGGAMDRPPYTYCGQRTDGSSYCAYHHDAGTQAPRERTGLRPHRRYLRGS